MGDASRREKHTHEIVWTLAAPTNWAEVDKTLNWIARELKPDATYDDIVRVTVGDDELVFTVDAQWIAPAPVGGEEKQ